MICDWAHVRQQLDSTDKDIFVTFRGKDSGNKTSRVQGTKCSSGLAIVGVKEQKAIIFHLSTLDEHDFEPSCRLITDYLTNNSLVKEVLFSFRHFNQPDNKGEPKLAILDTFKDHMKGVGYKWLRLDNNPDGSRWTCFIYRTGGKERGDSHERERQTRLKTGQLLIAKLQVKYLVTASHDLISSVQSTASMLYLTRHESV
jgi:hypothetical protein